MGIERAYRCETGVAVSLGGKFWHIALLSGNNYHRNSKFGIGIPVYINKNRHSFMRKFVVSRTGACYLLSRTIPNEGAYVYLPLSK